jgi:hypothetical protein
MSTISENVLDGPRFRKPSKKVIDQNNIGHVALRSHQEARDHYISAALPTLSSTRTGAPTEPSHTLLTPSNSLAALSSDANTTAALSGANNDDSVIQKGMFALFSSSHY